jgi:hypothetical protein
MEIVRIAHFVFASKEPASSHAHFSTLRLFGTFLLQETIKKSISYQYPLGDLFEKRAPPPHPDPLEAKVTYNKVLKDQVKLMRSRLNFKNSMRRSLLTRALVDAD